MKFWLLLLVTVAICAKAEEVVLKNERCSVAINPASLELQLTPAGKKSVTISGPQSIPGKVEQLTTTTNGARWTWNHFHLHARLDGESVSFGFAAEEASSLKWPVACTNAAVQAWILPMFEGVYVSANDARWISFLARDEMDTTADLGMPFIGWDCGDFTVTMILTNQFNNTLQFDGKSGALQASLTHQFTRNQTNKEFGVVIRLGTNSPIAPAMIYRQWLQERGQFVSLKEKIRQTPDVEKLIGAAQIYLWGSAWMAADDIKDWKKFAAALQSPAGKKIWDLLQPDAQKFARQIVSTQWPDSYMKSQVLDDLNRVLSGNDADCATLAGTFPDLLNDPDNWGDGVSPKMIRQLAAAGFDRLWLGVDSWDGLLQRPETAQLAEKDGFLIAPYDSYHSVHRPSEPDTWETAQFDQHLYDTGGIIKADGKPKAGFKKKGHILNSHAVRPYVEQRVNRLMSRFHANSWFLDCDGFGEYFDDYSPEHPATQESDMRERMSRMDWIEHQFGAVVGTEGCSAGVASAVCYAQGIITPVIGWGDPDLTDKKSKYYLGSYYPPNEPRVFFKSVPLKDEYRYIYYDPRFRLPLFETAFHDSVVATHHWSTGTLKFADAIGTTELLELLYNVPPLYHLNVAQFQKQKAKLKTYYDFFSPLHRAAGLLPLTEFSWLTQDRLVQRTVFGDEIELTANFSATPFQQGSATIPPQSILAKWRKTGVTKVFTPQ